MKSDMNIDTNSQNGHQPEFPPEAICLICQQPIDRPPGRSGPPRKVHTGGCHQEHMRRLALAAYNRRREAARETDKLRQTPQQALASGRLPWATPEICEALGRGLAAPQAQKAGAFLIVRPPDRRQGPSSAPAVQLLSTDGEPVAVSPERILLGAKLIKNGHGQKWHVRTPDRLESLGL